MLQEQSMGPGLYGKSNRKVCSLLDDHLRFLETPGIGQFMMRASEATSQLSKVVGPSANLGVGESSASVGGSSASVQIRHVAKTYTKITNTISIRRSLS